MFFSKMLKKSRKCFFWFLEHSGGSIKNRVAPPRFSDRSFTVKKGNAGLKNRLVCPNPTKNVPLGSE